MSRRSGQSGHVEKKGDYYVVRFWQDVAGQDKRVHRSVRLCPVSGIGSKTKPERLRIAREIIQASGADSAEYFREVQAINSGVTFRQQSELWLNHVQERKRKPVKAHTASTWRSHLKWINSHIGGLPLSDVSNLVLKNLVSEMQIRGFAPKTIRNYSAVVKLVVGSAIDPDGEQIYPRKWNDEYIDLPIVEDQRTPTFTAAEIETILCKSGDQFRVLYALLAATGLRIGEALALEASHFNNGALSIRQTLFHGTLTTPKTRAGVREVDLAPGIARMLGQFVGERRTGFIFRASNGAALRQSNILRRSLHPILAKLGREKCGFHSFRRFRVTHLRKQKTPEDLLRFWIGHGGKTITDVYSKIGEDFTFRQDEVARVGIGFEIDLVPCCPPTLNSNPTTEVLTVQ